MKIISSYNGNIEKLKLVDEIIIPTIYSINYDKAYNIHEIIEIITLCKENDVKAILSVDALLPENEVKNVYKLLDGLKNYDFDVMFSDISILAYFNNSKDRLIYNAPTYVCNYLDINYYKNLGVRVMISNELSIDDIRVNSKYDNVVLQVYGNYPIYYSKRRVVGLFKKHSGLEFDNLKELEMKEETRNERYIVKEYDIIPHTCILNAYKICIFKELNDIKPNYIYINTDNLDVIKMYKNDVFNEELENELKNIDERIDKSLLYSNPSILNQNEKN